ncbi:MAG TPA: glycosyltransferase family A protein [Gemmatimonadaceae bacterium]|jgi:glycosyltransferase involved in cell wall biosynthesis|nr:glycosyltransferase family A protein [Gemmatimonadaceae bacterium]
MSRGTAIVIPCYNHARYLGEAIESALAQTRAAAVITVVDDGSTEDVAAVAARYPSVRYVRQRNGGTSAARNTGLRTTRSEFLIFLDADDRLLPEAVELGEKRLRERPECAFAAGGTNTIAADGSLLQPWRPYPAYEDPYAAMLVDHCFIYPVSTIYRRSALEAANGFDVSFRRAEDWDIDLRLAEHFPFVLHQQPVGERRRHGNNISGDAAGMLAAIIRVQRSRRVATRRNAAHEAARLRGMRRTRAVYSEQVVTRIHELIDAGRWGAAIGLAATLLRSHPGILLERGALKAALLRERWGGSAGEGGKARPSSEPGGT